MQKLVLALSFFTTALFSQQWVDLNYSYDSVLNVSYGQSTNLVGELETHHMDIFIPKCPANSASKKWPLMLWIHGGGFIAGNKNDPSIQALCKKFAQRGYVTASIEYRLGMISSNRRIECNLNPDYPCLLATDSAEWYRSYFRAVQDAKGALRFLINKKEVLNIDENNVFVCGESAGAFTSLGVALLDIESEKPKEAYTIADAPTPHIKNLPCIYNQNKTFPIGNIPRHDLGSIDGNIEPNTPAYVIKGVGNIFGGMLSDLLKKSPSGKHKPVIYSFHQPCDIIVPIDSGSFFWGLSWCMVQGGCVSLSNTNAKIYGSRAFSNFNKTFNYGYTIKEEYGNINFPYNFLFGDGSCADQLNKPCHAYDNRNLRELNMAKFFATYVSTPGPCTSVNSDDANKEESVIIIPNPVQHNVEIRFPKSWENNIPFIQIYNVDLQTIKFIPNVQSSFVKIDLSDLPAGVYFIKFGQNHSHSFVKKIIKL